MPDDEKNEGATLVQIHNRSQYYLGHRAWFDGSKKRFHVWTPHCCFQINLDSGEVYASPPDRTTKVFEEISELVGVVQSQQRERADISEKLWHSEHERERGKETVAEQQAIIASLRETIVELRESNMTLRDRNYTVEAALDRIIKMIPWPWKGFAGRIRKKAIKDA